ncbi:MAG TPA: phenylalanine--tRNA ligase subunit beta [Gaiellaceae bacterium]|nr:phenylalanine--tRNA ligase subunit beta [Gaiellaceae bacterium]
MRVALSWLREYVPLEAPVDDVVTRLSVAAAEVEGYEVIGVPGDAKNLDRYKVGRVVEAIKHPNADRLQLTKVDVGEKSPRSIVCGAWNFGVGATVAVALPGAVIANGLELEKRKVRGEESDGMILAEDEVGLGEDHTGIMLLAESLVPGSPLADVLPLTDVVLNVESTGNRPDLLSVYGIARELAAIYDLPLADMPGDSPQTWPERTIDVRIDDAERCPRYDARLFEGVTIGESPLWLKARLRAAGVRSISNVVDITNYVMLALGSPLHAFDNTTLHEGRIVVRRAKKNEKLRTLDGVERELTTDDLVIADADRAVALAAIMGGEETEIGDATRTVLLEAANFEPYGIFRTSERLRHRTEGSNRWEKGVDPYLAEPAANMATELVLELTGARWTARTDVFPSPPARPVIAYRPARADEVIGIATPPEQQYALLDKLGFEHRNGDVTVPTWRARDVTREIDVVEEIARFRLEDVPFTLPQRRAMFGALTKEQRVRRRVEDALVGLGFAETYTPSLRPDDDTTWKLPEPISIELTAMRTQLLPSLVEGAQANLDWGVGDVALFEIARVYLPDGELPDEQLRVAAITQGDFRYGKGIVEALFAALNIELQEQRASDPLFHPGKCAHTSAGNFGELHPRLLEGTWCAFELDLGVLTAASPDAVRYEDVSTYPAVRQDIAVVVAEDVEAGAIVAAAHEAAGEELREARVFDVYRGEPVPAGKKSVAFSVAFQAPDRTLSDDDAAALRKKIVDALARKFGAELRAAS